MQLEIIIVGESPKDRYPMFSLICESYTKCRNSYMKACINMYLAWKYKRNSPEE